MSAETYDDNDSVLTRRPWAHDEIVMGTKKATMGSNHHAGGKERMLLSEGKK